MPTDRQITLFWNACIPEKGNFTGSGGCCPCPPEAPLNALQEGLAIENQTFYRNHLQIEAFFKLNKVINAGHRSVWVDDLAEDPYGSEACKLAEVYRGLGVALALQDSVTLGADRENMPRPNEVF